MARSDSDHLEKLRETRDALTDHIAVHGGTKPALLTIRNRTSQYNNPLKDLKDLEDLINAAERKAARSSRRGPARNVVQIRRGW